MIYYALACDILDFLANIRQILEKKWEYNEKVHQLFTTFEKAYYSVRREILYKNLTEFGISMKLSMLGKMCLNEFNIKVRIVKTLCSISYSEWSESRRCFSATAFQLCFRICYQEGPTKSGRIGNE
jgi:hypothetical protein